MEIKLKNIKEGSREAEMLSLAVRFYDHYSTPSRDEAFWEDAFNNAAKVIRMFEGTDYRVPVSQILVGMCDALDSKLRHDLTIGLETTAKKMAADIAELLSIALEMSDTDKCWEELVNAGERISRRYKGTSAAADVDQVIGNIWTLNERRFDKEGIKKR